MKYKYFKRNHTALLKMKTKICDMKNTWNGINNRSDIAENKELVSLRYYRRNHPK